ncbi:MAG TPA: hypothetical protein VGF75_00340 [Candidatus Saccharimonadales bacterium]|jgi:hypothetical protein
MSIYKIVVLLSLGLLSGCAPFKVTVYGTTGKQYIAPDLCGAISQCKQAKELDCYYNSSVVTSLDGKSTTVEVCKAAK